MKAARAPLQRPGPPQRKLRTHYVAIAADETAGPGLVAVLEGLGHDVTTAFATGSDPVLPADLGVYDTIWVIQAGGVPGVAETRLVDYVNAGGGLVITGERVCRNVSTRLRQ